MARRLRDKQQSTRADVIPFLISTRCRSCVHTYVCQWLQWWPEVEEQGVGVAVRPVTLKGQLSQWTSSGDIMCLWAIRRKCACSQLNEHCRRNQCASVQTASRACTAVWVWRSYHAALCWWWWGERTDLAHKCVHARAQEDSEGECHTL